ncbi:MAG: hypothetical protein Q7P63_11735 [Verrucomicrobiota bacterium JB022]|nr:hypothetical protein [Verrucomicrobiota bacterium JB022]
MRRPALIRLLSCLFTLLLVPASLRAQEVTFADPDLAALVRERLGLAAGEAITQEQMEEFIGITISDPAIESLEGLQAAVNMESVTLNGCQVTDLSPLAALPKLYAIGLQNVPVTDISPLRGLSSLRKLRFNGMTLPDFGPLEGHTLIEILDLQYVRGLNLGSLASIDTLTTLNIFAASIGDISALKSLPMLESLSLDLSNPANLSPLKDISTLRYVGLFGRATSDLSVLASFSQVTGLLLDLDYFQDLGFLAQMPQLEVLKIQLQTLSSLEFVKDLPRLVELRVAVGSAVDLTPLGELEYLERLFIRGPGGLSTSLDPLPLRNLGSLKMLRLANAGVSEISFLSSLSQLESLDLSDNRVSDLKPLDSLPLFEQLRLNRNRIDSILPLANLLQLKSVNLRENRLLLYEGSSADSAVKALEERGVETYIEDQKPLYSRLDIDQDGIADDWELVNWNSLDVADAASDFDGDGQSDLYEFLALRDPKDPDSRLIIELVSPNYDASIRLENLAVGRTYSLWKWSSSAGWFLLSEVTTTETDDLSTVLWDAAISDWPRDDAHFFTVQIRLAE